jgi:hypothetical protein
MIQKPRRVILGEALKHHAGVNGYWMPAFAGMTQREKTGFITP